MGGRPFPRYLEGPPPRKEIEIRTISPPSHKHLLSIRIRWAGEGRHEPPLCRPEPHRLARPRITKGRRKSLRVMLIS